MHDNFEMTSGVRLLGYVALVSLVIGTATAAAATERVTLSLVMSGAAGWSFVPLLQLVTGALLVRNTGPGTMSRLERYCSLHWPWTSWILVYHGALLVLPSRATGTWLTLTGVIPMVWTAWLLLGFCRGELSLDHRAAIRRVALHQGITYTVLFAYASVAVALWPRIVGVFE